MEDSDIVSTLLPKDLNKFIRIRSESQQWENLNEEIIPPIINDRVSPTNNNLKKSISHNLEKNEINPRRNLI